MKLTNDTYVIQLGTRNFTERATKRGEPARSRPGDQGLIRTYLLHRPAATKL